MMQLIADDKYLACNWKKGIKLNNYNSFSKLFFATELNKM